MPVQNSKLLTYEQDRSIVKVFYDQFTRKPPLWSRLFKKTTWPKGYEWTEADIAGLGGELREAAEGEAVEYITASQGNKVTRVPKKFQLGFQVTEEAIEDDLFGNVIKLASSLGRVASNTLEVSGAALFNNAFTTSLGKDGLALCADAHHTVRSPAGTAIDNKATADLDTTSLEAAFEYFQRLVGEDDLPIQMVLKLLMVPIGEQWKAMELMRAQGRVFDTADGDMNRGLTKISSTYYPTAMNAPNMLRPEMNPAQGASWDVIVNQYLTDTDAWFCLGDEVDLRMAMKREVKIQSADDLATGNRLYRCSTRFLAFMNEYRGIYGSTGA